MICGLCRTWRPKRKRGRIQALLDHWKRECGPNLGWERVVQLRQAGNLATADRVALKLMGVKKDAMTPEAREQVDEYNRVNRDKINAKKRQQRKERRQKITSARRHSVDITRKKI